MSIELAVPGLADLVDVVDVLAGWQRDDAPVQLHPGDVGWFSRHGATETAAALRLWTRHGEPVAIGLLDGVDVLRLTVSPAAWIDDDVARVIAADVSSPERGVLPPGEASIEAPDGTRVRDVLDAEGWRPGEPWTPLRCDLAGPVDAPRVTVEAVEVVDDANVADFAAVVNSAFGAPNASDERARTLLASPLYGTARSLLARDSDGAAVGAISVWTAGPGRPGLVEPLGVHADHRRHGYGLAMCLAGAAALRELGSSSVLVCTTSDRTPAIATYRAAGYEVLPERLDRTRVA